MRAKRLRDLALVAPSLIFLSIDASSMNSWSVVTNEGPIRALAFSSEIQ